MSQALFKNIILLVSVALLVAAPVLYFNMLRPTIDNAQQLNGQLESEKEVLKNIQNIADGLNEQIQKITVSGGDKKLEQVIPNGSQISTLLNEIYAMGAQSNVVVTGIIPILKVNTHQPDAEKNIFLKKMNSAHNFLHARCDHSESTSLDSRFF